MVEGVSLWLHGDGKQRWSRRARLHDTRLSGVEDGGHKVRDEAEHSVVGALSVALVLGSMSQCDGRRRSLHVAWDREGAHVGVAHHNVVVATLDDGELGGAGDQAKVKEVIARAWLPLSM